MGNYCTLTGVAIGAGLQSVVAYVNIGCYYVVGVPIGALLGYVAHLEVKVNYVQCVYNITINWDSNLTNNAVCL